MNDMPPDKKQIVSTTPSGINIFDQNNPGVFIANPTHPHALASNDLRHLEEYLDQCIDGYLLADLESITTRIPPDLHPGAASYPMVLATCAGMEFLGALLRPTSEDEFNEDDGIKYFGHYWKHYLSKVNPQYEKYGEVTRTLVRNGLAHLFITKPKIGIVKSDPSRHLKTEGEHLIIGAVQLYEDFKKSYIEYAKPVILDGKDGTQLASRRLRQMMDKYTAESERVLKIL